MQVLQRERTTHPLVRSLGVPATMEVACTGPEQSRCSTRSDWPTPEADLLSQVSDVALLCPVAHVNGGLLDQGREVDIPMQTNLQGQAHAMARPRLSSLHDNTGWTPWSPVLLPPQTPHSGTVTLPSCLLPISSFGSWCFLAGSCADRC